MSNEINIKINVSDELLAKLMRLMVQQAPPPPMALPMGLLGALQPPTPPNPPKEKSKVGFKIN